MAGDIVFVVVTIGLIGAVVTAACVMSLRSHAVSSRVAMRSIALVGIVFMIGLGQEIGLRSVASGDTLSRVDDWLLGPGQFIFSVAALSVMVHGYRTWIDHRAQILAEAGVANTAVSHIPFVGDRGDVDLTPREREVLEAMQSGALTDVEIATVLYVSRATAATHVRNILRKTGLHNRRDLLLLDQQRSVRER